MTVLPPPPPLPHTLKGEIKLQEIAFHSLRHQRRTNYDVKTWIMDD